MGGSKGDCDERNRHRGPHPFDGDCVRRAAFLAILVFALAAGALALTRFHTAVASVWLANAVVVGIVIRAPRRDHAVLLSVAFAAYFAANIVNREPLILAAVLAAVNIIESAIVIYPMTRLFAKRARFDHGYVIVRFILYAGAVAPLCSALLAATAMALVGGVEFTTALLRWYVADALGLLTLGALLLALRNKENDRPARGAWIAGWAGVILPSAAAAIAFTRDSGSALFAVAPIMMIAALRAPLRATMAALVGCSTIAVVLTVSGFGPLAAADVDAATRSYLLQGFIASLLFVVLPVRILIGERDRLGGVIARSERLFARIAEASPAGTIHFDPLGRPTYANQRWNDLTGLDRGALDEDRWLDAIDPADRSAASSLWSRARATLEPCSEEYRFLAHGAPAGFAELNFFPEIEDGRVLGFVARLTDVTDRRRAEDALQQREARYRLITENSQDVILRLGLDGCPHYVSGASLRVTGYAPAELIGRSLADFIHAADRPVFARTLARLAAGNADGAIEFRLRHRDGHYRWFESSQRPLFDDTGAPVELVASLRDIHQRRHSERRASAAAARLRETNRLLLLAEELAGVGSWQLDTRDQAMVLAPQINRVLGRKRADRLRGSEILGVVHRADRRHLLACLARARRCPDSAECALRVHAADGLRHVRLVAQAEHEDGDFAGWVGVAHDVTDKVESEAALIAARDEAQAAALAKSHFLATMSHEIRTPMTGVLGMIDLLRDSPAPRERERYFAALAQSAAMLVSVVDDVLDFSKIDSGTLRLEQSDFDLEAMARATIDLFGTAASRKGLTLSFESSCAEQALVRGDPVRLQQVLSNLLSNAIKFTECGQIKVSLASQATEDGARYQIAVADSGIGLEPNQIDHLFAPFVQADVTTSRRYGGTGLGLAISRRLVEAMGGKLEVASIPGQGSTFIFDVTLPEGQVSNITETDETGHPCGISLDVLVAEDNPISQMLVAALVRRMGHQVTLVANGREAVEAAAAHRFDAILMDMQMPELDGLAATRTIRGSGGPCANIPIFALTADASAERRRFYDGAGLTDFLTKPIDRAALAARLAGIARPAPRPGEHLQVVTSAASDLFDADRVDELRSALGSYRFDALLGLLISECRDRPARLRLALRRHDLAALHAEAHSLKGAAAGIGAAALGLVALRFEQANDLAAAGRLIGELETTARATLAAAEQLISQPPSDRATA